MSAPPVPDHTDAVPAQIIPLHPRPAPAPVSAPSSQAERRAVIPEPLQRANIRATVRYTAGLASHHTYYHGLRAPAYLLLYLWHALRGLAVLSARLIRWWHVPELHGLVSLAVALGRPGHHDALNAHREGKKTRAARGRIIAVCGVLALAATISGLIWLPLWGWALAAIVLVLALARHGRPEGKQVIRSATVAPQYQVPTPEIITRALGSLGLAGINDALRTGAGITYVSDVHRDGDGWATELDLPHGITAQMILQRRAQLASGLRRPLSATWPEPVPAEHEGRLRLWIGFHDISKLKPASWPLVRAG